MATLSWAMRDRPTWDQHRVPLRAKHNWFKACSELTFRCNPLRAEEEVLCLQRCSTRPLPAVGRRTGAFFKKKIVLFFPPSLSKLAAQIQLNVCQFTDLHCDRRLSDLTWRNTHSAPRHRPLLPSSALLDYSATTSPSSSPTSEMPLVCERWRESVSEVSRSNISSSNTRWDTRTPEHDCWIENGLRSRYEWRACISLDMSVATIACRIGSHHHRHPPSILSGAFGA